MSELTTFGIFHTGLSLIGLGAGIAALVKHREIAPNTTLGKNSLAFTLASAVTGLAIFHHGGFGPPHVLSLMTIAVITLGMIANRTSLFGNASFTVQTVSFSATILFHLIPALTETTTRLPPSSPVFPGPDAPPLQIANALMLAAFIVGVVIQLRVLRGPSQAKELLPR